MRHTRLRTAMLLGATFLAVAPVRAQEGQDPGGAEASARQPEWTSRALFSESEVYVLPRGRTAFEVDLRPTRPASRSR